MNKAKQRIILFTIITVAAVCSLSANVEQHWYNKSLNKEYVLFRQKSAQQDSINAILFEKLYNNIRQDSIIQADYREKETEIKKVSVQYMETINSIINQKSWSK